MVCVLCDCVIQAPRGSFHSLKVRTHPSFAQFFHLVNGVLCASRNILGRIPKSLVPQEEIKEEIVYVGLGNFVFDHTGRHGFKLLLLVSDILEESLKGCDLLSCRCSMLCLEEVIGLSQAHMQGVPANHSYWGEVHRYRLGTIMGVSKKEILVTISLPVTRISPGSFANPQ